MNLKMVVPIQIGIVALLIGSYFVVQAVRGPATPSTVPAATVASTQPAEPALAPFTSKKGGFELGVPAGMKAARKGKTVTVTSADRSLVVTASPGERGSLSAGGRDFVSSLKAGYTKVKVAGTEKQQVDGRSALATFGQAKNRDGVPIRFVHLVVAAKPRNYVITSYAGRDTDPAVVLPKVNAVVNSFTLLN